MSSTTKFQSYVLALTTLLVFTFWFKYGQKIDVSPYLKIISTSLISLGLYRFVALIFLFILKKNRLVRIFFLGPKYLEGTWVGFYIGISGKVRYIVDTEVYNGTGIVFFNFHRKNKDSAPTMINGFSADLHNNGIRTKSLEYKLSRNCKLTDAQALEKAIEFYNMNKNNF